MKKYKLLMILLVGFVYWVLLSSFMSKEKVVDQQTGNPYQITLHKSKPIASIKKDLTKDRLIEYVQSEQVLPEPLKNDIHRKVIALTFDDGPNPSSTNRILDALKKHSSYATFFVLGNRAQRYPETVQRIVKEGNEVGNHSWDHRLFTKLNEDEIHHEVYDTESIIEQVSGYRPVHLRPPFGAVDERVRQSIGDMSVALWNVDSEDWKYKNTQKIIENVMCKAGDGKIILMHDIYQTSAEAAEQIIEQLSNQGYILVTMAQLEEVQKRRGMLSP
ncbi:polysaccharide deacetylase family protein [Bacillus sp. 03113]|uniref:polysaccharide deacetylase family protein n=1 Tax=Bacillus sp. 03113 TaxID=2578211 RepID=UPI00114278B3|nr:polysaccharide deacetylase family protein [Bacillus sp. 03113]